MTLPKVYGEGRLGADPELRFTHTGVAVCSVSVACTKRRKNEATGEWEDAETTWLRLNLWRAQAERCAEHAHRGDLIVFTGELGVREYERRDGGKGTSVEVDVDWWGLTPTGPRSATAPASAPTEDPWAPS